MDIDNSENIRRKIAVFENKIYIAKSDRVFFAHLAEFVEFIQLEPLLKPIVKELDEKQVALTKNRLKNNFQSIVSPWLAYHQLSLFKNATETIGSDFNKDLEKYNAAFNLKKVNAKQHAKKMEELLFGFGAQALHKETPQLAFDRRKYISFFEIIKQYILDKLTQKTAKCQLMGYRFIVKPTDGEPIAMVFETRRSTMHEYGLFSCFYQHWYKFGNKPISKEKTQNCLNKKSIDISSETFIKNLVGNINKKIKYSKLENYLNIHYSRKDLGYIVNIKCKPEA